MFHRQVIGAFIVLAKAVQLRVNARNEAMAIRGDWLMRAYANGRG